MWCELTLKHIRQWCKRFCSINTVHCIIIYELTNSCEIGNHFPLTSVIMTLYANLYIFMAKWVSEQIPWQYQHSIVQRWIKASLQKGGCDLLYIMLFRRVSVGFVLNLIIAVMVSWVLYVLSCFLRNLWDVKRYYHNLSWRWQSNITRHGRWKYELHYYRFINPLIKHVFSFTL